jgi:hypothetical protein
MPVEMYVELCTPLKPGFIHHPETKKILQEVVAEYGYDFTSLRDFMKGADLSRMPESVVREYDDVEAPEEAKIFKPELVTSVR